jgi:hypothetical protein
VKETAAGETKWLRRLLNIDYRTISQWGLEQQTSPYHHSPFSEDDIFKLLRTQESIMPANVASAQICKRLRSPGIDSASLYSLCWNF